MVTAIVLIKADVARIPETAEEIAKIPAVSEVYSVTGEFDLVAMVRVRAHEELGDVIPGTVNKVPGVTHTETHIAFRTYSRHDLEAAFAHRVRRGLKPRRFAQSWPGLRRHGDASRWLAATQRSSRSAAAPESMPRPPAGSRRPGPASASGPATPRRRPAPPQR